MFNLAPIYSACKSSNHKLSINHKISHDTNLHKTYKHRTQNVRRISPFSITPVEKAHKTHISNCCFLSESYWKLYILSPVTMSQTRPHGPLTSFFSIHMHPVTLPLFLLFSKARDPKGAMLQDAEVIMEKGVHTSWWMPSAPFISSCVILGSFLISNFTLNTFSTVMVITGRS